MNNLELTLSKAEEELNNKNIPAVKTLMDIYMNLLFKFNRDGWNSGIDEFRNELLKHSSKLDTIYKTANNELEKYLSNGDYKEAYYITTALRKIEESLFIVDNELNKIN